MKKLMCVLLSIMMLLAVMGCGSESGQNTAVEQALQDGMDAFDGVNTGGGRQSGLNEGAPLPDPTPNDAVLSKTKGIDVDLTILSANVVYAEVYDMVGNPDKYKGKTIKMSGMYTGYEDAFLGVHYSSCIIQDATACCSQGIEFQPKSKYKYPDDYPIDGDNVTVIGKFDTYMDGDYQFCVLKNAEISIERA